MENETTSSTFEESTSSVALNTEADISPNKDGKLVKTLLKQGRGIYDTFL